MTSEPTVFVVDDCPDMCKLLEAMLNSSGLKVESYRSAEDFLKAGLADRAGCLLLDVSMPGMGGLDLLDGLKGEGIELPVIVLTGKAEVPSAVRAMKAGAIDFIEKPVPDVELIARIRHALDLDEAARGARARSQEILSRLSRLTKREREVMGLVVAGRANKQIAEQLGISPKTVEVHRANVMRKSEAGSVAELVTMAGANMLVFGDALS